MVSFVFKLYLPQQAGWVDYLNFQLGEIFKQRVLGNDSYRLPCYEHRLVYLDLVVRDESIENLLSREAWAAKMKALPVFPVAGYTSLFREREQVRAEVEGDAQRIQEQLDQDESLQYRLSSIERLKVKELKRELKRLRKSTFLFSLL